jgi:predicted enzyme related to lactoylglutathione lyase
MADANIRLPGQIGWVDLTVTDAEGIRDFYQQVTGWTPSPVQMGDYQDFCMVAPGNGQMVAGICHARGENAELPPVWMITSLWRTSKKACGFAWSAGAKYGYLPAAWAGRTGTV